MNSKLKPPLKIQHNKCNSKNFVVSHFPKNQEELTYIEPMCGNAEIFFAKDRSVSEMLSDTDERIISFFRALRDEPSDVATRLKRIRCTERTFQIHQKRCETPFDDYIDRAISEYVVNRMSRGGHGKNFAWPNGDGTESWESGVKDAIALSERLSNVILLNKDVFNIFKTWDEENVLWYLAPNALPDSDEEVKNNPGFLSMEQHVELLNLARDARGKVCISAYASPLYNRTLKGWKTVKKDQKADKSKNKKQEVLWMNYDPTK